MRVQEAALSLKFGIHKQELREAWNADVQDPRRIAMTTALSAALITQTLSD